MIYEIVTEAFKQNKTTTTTIGERNHNFGPKYSVFCNITTTPPPNHPPQISLYEGADDRA